MAQISIIMGSKSDKELAEKAQKILDEFKVDYDVQVISAHRNPERLAEYIKESENTGTKIYIAIAGLAAHLPGVISSQTLLPVLGVPGDGGPLQGLDALLSIVQMPKGVPVASLAIGSHGATNAALIAIRILALNDENLLSAMQKYVDGMKK
ncbi:MAG: 5-(carboxyamino)imidazole ribonucleotide mutase [Candidatus Zixiibacteriota bacterium]